MTNETLDLLESVLRDELNKTRTEIDDVHRTKAIQNACMLAERLNEAEGNVAKWQESENRTEIEKEKIRSTIQIETNKKHLTNGQIALEIAKVAVPAGVSVLGYAVYRTSFKEMGHFEETGRYISNMSRELHLPKIIK